MQHPDPFAPTEVPGGAQPSVGKTNSFVRIESVEEQKLRKKMMMQTDPNFGLGGRARAPSVAADFEVKMLLSNLTSMSESESEADSSELETEIDQTLGKLEQEKRAKRSPRRISQEIPHPPRPNAVNRRASNTPDNRKSIEWWTEVKSNLQREAEKLLEDPSAVNSPTNNRRRTRSWLVAKEDMERILSEAAAESSSYEQLPGLGVQGVEVPSVESTSAPEAKKEAPQETQKETQPADAQGPEVEQEESSSSPEEQDLNAEDNSWWESLKESLDQAPATPASPATPATEESTTPKAVSVRPSVIRKMDSAPVLPSATGEKEVISVKKEKKERSQKDHDKRGILKFDNGVYRGETTVTPESYSTAHGYGTFHANNGELYIGQWNNGKREGKGIKTWDDGREYTGQWVNNRRTGYGIMTHPNGDVYIGELQFGFQQGHGMLKSADGDKYIGEWNVNERHGFGVMNFKNGDTYAGEWQHNKKQGHGIYRFADGKFVEGEWADNKFMKKKKGDGSAPKEKKEKKRSKSLTKASKKKVLEEKKEKEEKEKKEKEEKAQKEKEEKAQKEKEEKEKKEKEKREIKKKTPSKMSLLSIIASSKEKKDREKERQDRDPHASL